MSSQFLQVVHFPAAGIKYVKVEQSNSNPQFYHCLNNNDYSLNHYRKDNISNVMYQKEEYEAAQSF